MGLGFVFGVLPGVWACDTPNAFSRNLGAVTSAPPAHVAASPSARSSRPSAADESWIVSGARDDAGHALEFAVTGARVTPLTRAPVGTRVVDLHGYYVVPAFIDSHVHLSYYPVADGLPAGGIVAAVDFAAPLTSLHESLAIPVWRAGPMITSVAGYPTQSWGAGGFGLEVASASAAEGAVGQVLAAGANFIKVPLAGTDGVDDAMLTAIVARAHALGAKVAVHALGAVDAGRAIASQVDVLGHTPTETLSQDQVMAWGKRAVVSTLAAFGSSAAAVANLRAFSTSGALILYGTDLGNTRFVGIQSAEIAGLLQAGLSGSGIVRSATADAADYWGFSELGRLAPGKRASFLVLSEDPNQNPQTLATPQAVVVNGNVVSGSLP